MYILIPLCRCVPSVFSKEALLIFIQVRPGVRVRVFNVCACAFVCVCVLRLRVCVCVCVTSARVLLVACSTLNNNVMHHKIKEFTVHKLCKRGFVREMMGCSGDAAHIAAMVGAS